MVVGGPCKGGPYQGVGGMGGMGGPPTAATIGQASHTFGAKMLTTVRRAVAAIMVVCVVASLYSLLHVLS